MNPGEMRRSGHWPTLLCAFLYFDISFMIWVLLGALGVGLAAEFHLDAASKGLMVAVPILGGSILRLGMGILADRWGAKRTGLLGLATTTIPLLLGYFWVNNFSQLLIVGLLLGVAGASFAVALPLASRWYPPERQGFVLGIAGAGNSGTLISMVFAPRLAPYLGWRGVFALCLIPVIVTFIVFALFAKDAPGRPAPKRVSDYVKLLGRADTYRFCFFYSVTFGGFVGLSSYLPIFFKDRYGIDPVRAGMLTMICGAAGSFLRPVGGYLSDRFGGVGVLSVLFVLLTAAAGLMSTSPPIALGMTTLVFAMAILGLGNGSVFQLVPQRFAKDMGVITGWVGAAGGFGGFGLPIILGRLYQATGSFGPGFLMLALIGVSATFAIRRIGAAPSEAFVARIEREPAEIAYGNELPPVLAPAAFETT